MKEMTCTEPDCKRPARGRGLCGTHYVYRSRHGTLPPKIRQDTSRTCEAPDCEDPVGLHGGRGLCPKHYQRLTKSRWGLEQPPRTAPLAERFRAMTSDEPCPCGCGCLLWTGGINKKTGYGHFSIGNKTYLAHRVAFELAEGRPIADEMAIDHVYEQGCRHRHCVNRAHLEEVTDAVNNQRIPISPVVRERRSAAGQKAWSKIGTERLRARCPECGRDILISQGKLRKHYARPGMDVHCQASGQEIEEITP